jgi:ABC-2 type transport system permease protein
MSAGIRKGPPRTRGEASEFVGIVRHAELNALFGFAERQLHVVKRYWLWELVWLFYSLVSVLSIGFLASGLGTLGVEGGSFDLRRAQLYLLIGALLWGYLSLVFMEAAYAISWERWEGTIEYTFMAPVRRVTHLFGICLFAIGYGLARTFVVFLVAAMLFNLDFSHADVAGALVVLAASTVPLIGLSILTAVLPLLSPQKGEQMSIALQGFLLLVSGVYYPLSVLPVPMQLAGEASPLTYALDGIRRSLLSGAGVRDQVETVAILLVMGAILIPLSIGIFGWAENRAKRLGLLKRSG